MLWELAKVVGKFCITMDISFRT